MLRSCARNEQKLEQVVTARTQGSAIESGRLRKSERVPRGSLSLDPEVPKWMRETRENYRYIKEEMAARGLLAKKTEPPERTLKGRLGARSTEASARPS
jgi:hypothetical protein